VLEQAGQELDDCGELGEADGGCMHARLSRSPLDARQNRVGRHVEP
jgi:hypothetical protein